MIGIYNTHTRTHIKTHQHTSQSSFFIVHLTERTKIEWNKAQLIQKIKINRQQKKTNEMDEQKQTIRIQSIFFSV